MALGAGEKHRGMILVFESADRRGAVTTISGASLLMNLQQRDNAVMALFDWHGTLTAPATYEVLGCRLKDIVMMMKKEDPPPPRTSYWVFERGMCRERETPVVLPAGTLKGYVRGRSMHLHHGEGAQTKVFREVMVPCAEEDDDIVAYCAGQRASLSDCSRMLVRYHFSDGTPSCEQVLIATQNGGTGHRGYLSAVMQGSARGGLTPQLSRVGRHPDSS